MSIQTIETPQELSENISALIAIEPKFAAIYEQVGLPDLRHNAGGFEQLMRAMVGQQLSVAAAASIWKRLVDAALTTPYKIGEATDEALKAQGLSKQKTRYIRSLVDHNIDFAALENMPNEEVINTLTAVTGIGRWTAEMYLLFSLKRADVLAVDDLAIKVAAMELLGLAERPTPKQLNNLTQHWSPYRSAASLLLWSYYGLLRNKTAVPL
ncbi:MULTISPECIES: DNA-3-methyladenine glycosylase 2 family protein [Psychrobacter]|jgi:DNA-3-methyladenine glycosylase II|uniref:DNA-3-methyladenine glycosylase II n=1 Tax=Psychrobacter pocilloporae TaxID=1775882 RepID=A0ABT6ITR0_9GAMM|nr:DNA-3-methyladenine glycosylase 2 family protein [Psychrobacter pocilloporae]MDH4904901.1 3-methyladenine DNA glycosylase [Psychrobacter pocilloporae]HBD04782.1 3-methyladenine DNA glycosylase [Psychrobacter sp.]|tara:strand:+ start:2034 stop:2666 length:633 start_codon:yes stop_codon:yes gene_type:complete